MCKHCDVKTPRNNAAVAIGKYPIGKPLFVNRDECGVYAYAVISHENGCPVAPDEDEWHLSYINCGAGHYIPINYCPMCGRDLRGGDHA